MIRALTHSPSPNMAAAIRTHAALDADIDLDRAHRQHAEYCAALVRAGAIVDVLDVNAQHPDAVFIEDTAIVLDEIAVMTQMGAEPRRLEPSAIEPALMRFRKTIARIDAGTLEGGDVIVVGKTLLVGRSERTSTAGIAALAAIVQAFGYAVKSVQVEGCLHLKTACTALPNGALLMNRAWLPAFEKELAGFDYVTVDDREPHGANVVVIGNDVVIADAFPRTAQRIVDGNHARNVHAVALGEFAKADGCATCLSLVFNDANPVPNAIPNAMDEVRL